MPYQNLLTDEDKERLIAEALQTHEGREALAWAMVEPIARNFGLVPPKRKHDWRTFKKRYIFEEL